MGDDNAGDAELALQFEDQFVDDIGADWIEAGGGFIVEDDFRLKHNGASEGDALALASGEIDGHFPHGVNEANHAEHLPDALLALRFGHLSMFDEREGDVLGHGHGIEKRALLEEESELSANRSQTAFAEIVDALIFEPHFAEVRLEEGDDVFEQDGLAAAAGPHDDGGLAGGDVEGDSAEDGMAAKGFPKLYQADDRRL